MNEGLNGTRTFRAAIVGHVCIACAFLNVIYHRDASRMFKVEDRPSTTN